MAGAPAGAGMPDGLGGALDEAAAGAGPPAGRGVSAAVAPEGPPAGLGTGAGPPAGADGGGAEDEVAAVGAEVEAGMDACGFAVGAGTSAGTLFTLDVPVWRCLPINQKATPPSTNNANTILPQGKPDEVVAAAFGVDTEFDTEVGTEGDVEPLDVVLGAAALGSTVKLSCPFSSCKVLSPIPLTRPKSSSDLNGPLAVRSSTIACALPGPMPGNCSISDWAAVLIFTLAHTNVVLSRNNKMLRIISFMVAPIGNRDIEKQTGHLVGAPAAIIYLTVALRSQTRPVLHLQKAGHTQSDATG